MELIKIIIPAFATIIWQVNAVLYFNLYRKTYVITYLIIMILAEVLVILYGLMGISYLMGF